MVDPHTIVESPIRPMNSAWRSGLQQLWALHEQAYRFDLGHVLNSAVTDAIQPEAIGGLGIHHAGLWECDLRDDTLTWSGGVYDLFGLERGLRVTRAQAVAHYKEESRAAMERLRTHAIRHQRGFTLDVEIRAAAVGEVRRMRLIAAPVYQNGIAIRLRGLKILLG